MKLHSVFTLSSYLSCRLFFVIPPPVCSSRYFHWRLTIYVMLFNLIVIIPLYTFYLFIKNVNIGMFESYKPSKLLPSALLVTPSSISSHLNIFLLFIRLTYRFLSLHLIADQYTFSNMHLFPHFSILLTALPHWYACQCQTTQLCARWRWCCGPSTYTCSGG